MLILIHNSDSLTPTDAANLNYNCVNDLELIPKVAAVLLLVTVDLYCQIRKIRISCHCCYYYCYCNDYLQNFILPLLIQSDGEDCISPLLTSRDNILHLHLL